MHNIDCIIFATGFEVGTDYSRRAGYGIVGVDGMTVSEKWSDGLSTFHGMHAKGFPNCFFFGPAQSGFTATYTFSLDENSVHLAHILNEANNLVKKNNAKLYFVYLNTDPRFRANYEKSYKKILSIVKNLNIPIIDIYEEVISKHPDPDSLYPFRMFSHYNEEGYRLVAEAILNHFNYD